MTVRDLVAALTPVDELERVHRSQVLDWLAGTDDVYRRVKPATPPQHLVSYVLPVDRADGSVLLVDHINAGLWLPPGGHVEPGEDPAVTAVRELEEELGLRGTPEGPLFLTVTRTVGIDAGHTDVSLWFVVPCDRYAVPAVTDAAPALTGSATPLTPEFNAVRWWTRAELATADPARFDPHLFRFLAKLPG